MINIFPNNLIIVIVIVIKMIDTINYDKNISNDGWINALERVSSIILIILVGLAIVCLI